MKDLTKYMQERDKRKRSGMYLTDMSLQEALRQGQMLTNAELARIWSDRSGHEISPMSLGDWLNGNRIPEGDNRRAVVNATGIEYYKIIEEHYFEANDELAQEVEKEGSDLTPEDRAEIRAIIERSRKRRGFYGKTELANGAA